MTGGQDPKICLELELSTDQPGLLEGLDQWIKLGLISDQQVRTLCLEQLACELPPPFESVPGQSSEADSPSTDSPSPSALSPAPSLTNPFDEARESLATEASSVPDFLPYSEEPDSSPESSSRRGVRRSPEPQSRSSTSTGPAAPGRESPSPTRPVSLWLDRLISELSVIWLLGLGVFLVVLSSAVLAATQWARFNAVGQYLVLLAYTLVFWGIGRWSSRNEHLQLTSRTLQMITLLLVPLNFWAMDGLGVWTSVRGFLVAAIAAVALTLAALQVMGKQQTPVIKQVNALGLSYLHCGWGWTAVPVVTVYVGVLGSAIAALLTATAGTDPPASTRSSRWATLAVFFALGLLLLRSLSTLPDGNWGRLGLAFGLYGATWVWLGQNQWGQSQAAASRPGAIPRGGIWLGRALLWWGWLISIDDFRFQAFGVSILGLGLRLQALQKLGRRRDLLVGYGIGVQLAFVGWRLVPSAMRQAIMDPLATWVSIRGGETFALLGLSLFPYVIAMVALGDWYLRQGQTKLGRFSDGIALGSNVLLTGFSLFSPPVLVVHLIASTTTALIGTCRRRPIRQWRILLSYGLALITIIVTIDNLWPNLASSRWMVVMTMLAVLWLCLGKWLPEPWSQNANLYAYGLSGLAYVLLWTHLVETSFQSSLSWIGFLIPLILTVTGRYRVSLVATALAFPLTLGVAWTRLVGLGTATVLTLVNSALYRRPWAAYMAVGLGLGFIVGIWEDLIAGYPNNAADWCVITVGLMTVLGIIWRWLPDPDPEDSTVRLPLLYKNAADAWWHLLAVGLLVFMSLALGFLYSGAGVPQGAYGIAQVSLLIVLALRYGRQVQSNTVYLAGWTGELLVAQTLAWREPMAVSLAVPTLGLGAIALVLATVLRRSASNLVPPLHTLTLAYAILALALRSTTTTAWTGWLVIGAALLLLEVGRRTRQAPLRWLALLGLSIGWYELVLYQLFQSGGDSPVDGVIVLAGVAVLIMAVYRLAANRLDRHLGLPQIDLIWAAHIHWVIGSVLMLAVGIMLPFMDTDLSWAGLAIATALVIYALLQGRIGSRHALQAAWVYAGLVELVGWFAILRFTFSSLQALDSWWGAVACALAVPIYWIPWSRQGWPQRPWRVMAAGVPLAITGLTRGFDHIPSLWILAGFYGWLAWHSHRIQVSYLSAASIVWAIWIWLEQQKIHDALAFILPLGAALLYIAQVEPCLARPDARGARHGLRLMAAGVILLTALFSDRWTGLPVGVMALGAIAAGLFCRTRAFLYAGTVVFVLNALNQLILLNATYPFVKWVVGILVGVALIWIAADFERRRDQWLMLTQNWMQDLDGWQ